MYHCVIFFFFKQKTAYEVRISDWSSDVCSSDLDRGLVIVRLGSGEQRYIRGECMGTVGAVSNPDNQNTNLGKAGRNRWLGKRPLTRGVAKNPVDHPHGGGDGRTSGRSEEHTSELQSLMRISYAVFCLKKQTE